MPRSSPYRIELTSEAEERELARRAGRRVQPPLPEVVRAKIVLLAAEAW